MRLLKHSVWISRLGQAFLNKDLLEFKSYPVDIKLAASSALDILPQLVIIYNRLVPICRVHRVLILVRQSVSIGYSNIQPPWDFHLKMEPVINII